MTEIILLSTSNVEFETDALSGWVVHESVPGSGLASAIDLEFFPYETGTIKSITGTIYSSGSVFEYYSLIIKPSVVPVPAAA